MLDDYPSEPCYAFDHATMRLLLKMNAPIAFEVYCFLRLVAGPLQTINDAQWTQEKLTVSAIRAAVHQIEKHTFLDALALLEHFGFVCVTRPGHGLVYAFPEFSATQVAFEQAQESGKRPLPSRKRSRPVRLVSSQMDEQKVSNGPQPGVQTTPIECPMDTIAHASPASSSGHSHVEDTTNAGDAIRTSRRVRAGVSQSAREVPAAPIAHDEVCQLRWNFAESVHPSPVGTDPPPVELNDATETLQMTAIPLTDALPTKRQRGSPAKAAADTSAAPEEGDPAPPKRRGRPPSTTTKPEKEPTRDAQGKVARDFLEAYCATTRTKFNEFPILKAVLEHLRKLIEFGLQCDEMDEFLRWVRQSNYRKKWPDVMWLCREYPKWRAAQREADTEGNQLLRQYEMYAPPPRGPQVDTPV